MVFIKGMLGILTSSGDRMLIALGLIFLAMGTIMAVRGFIQGRRHSSPLMYALILISFALHTGGIILRGQSTGSCPLNNGYEVLQFLVWTLLFIFLILGAAFRISLLGFFTAALSLIMGSAGLLIPALDRPYQRLHPPEFWVELHASGALFAYGIFGMLTLTSLMLILQEYSLKKKHFDGLFQYLPSLVQLDKMNLRLLIAGNIIFTAALVSGILAWGFSLAPSVANFKLWSIALVWTLYMGTLVLKLRKQWPASRIAVCCIILFLIALGSLLPIEWSRTAVSLTLP